MARTDAGHSPVESLNEEVHGLLQGMDEFIASTVGTVIDVDPRDRDGKLWLRNTRMGMGQASVSLRLAPHADYPSINSGDPSTVDYECVQYGGKDEVSFELYERAQYPGDLIDEAAENVARALLVELETTMSTLLFTSGNWGSTSTLAALAGGSGVQIGGLGATEIADLRIARKLCRDSANGVAPNALIIGYEAFDKLAVATDFRAYYGDSANRTALNEGDTLAALSRALDIPVANISVGRARYETANPSATSSQADVWGDSILFYYKDERTTPMSGGAGLRGTSVALVRELLSDVGVMAERDEDRSRREHIVRGRWSYNAVIVNNGWGYLLTDCVA